MMAEIKKTDKTVMSAPGCANLGEGNKGDHCLEMWQCRFGGVCGVGINRSQSPEHLIETTPGQKMDGGVPRNR